MKRITFKSFQELVNSRKDYHKGWITLESAYENTFYLRQYSDQYSSASNILKQGTGKEVYAYWQGMSLEKYENLPEHESHRNGKEPISLKRMMEIYTPKGKIAFKVVPSLVLTQEEKDQIRLHSVGANCKPQTYQRIFINDLYEKTLDGKITGYFNKELYEIYMKNQKIRSDYHAKCTILSWVASMPTELTAEEAAKIFYNTLLNQETTQYLYSKGYQPV